MLDTWQSKDNFCSNIPLVASHNHQFLTLNPRILAVGFILNPRILAVGFDWY